GGAFHTSNGFGADLLVMPADRKTIVAARGFDSRWRWAGARDASPLLPAPLQDAPQIASGVTRVSDVVPFYANIPIGEFEASGSRLLELAGHAGAKDSGFMIAG